MMHDFAITETDAVFWDLPVVFDLEAATKYIEDPRAGRSRTSGVRRPAPGSA